MKPFGALYYIKENKGRVAICTVIIAMTFALFILGNYVESGPKSFEKEFEYGDKMIFCSYAKNEQDYLDFLEDVKKDEKLKYIEVTGYGYSGLAYKTALGFEMGGNCYVFNSLDDMKRAFEVFGIECDFSNVKDGSLVISETLAKNRGIKLGDVLDHSFDSAFDEEHSVDAFINDGSGLCFYLEEVDNLWRFYAYSDSMEGEELYQYIKNIAGDRQVLVNRPSRISADFSIFYIIFYTVVILISVILAVTVNSVLTGQYMKRKYEFGVYRALGRTKANVFFKCAKEILLMDLMGSAIGGAVCFLLTYLLREFVYKPKGILLVYTSKVALIGYLLCNALIVVPVILINGRMCVKADVTEF